MHGGSLARNAELNQGRKEVKKKEEEVIKEWNLNSDLGLLIPRYFLRLLQSSADEGPRA